MSTTTTLPHIVTQPPVVKDRTRLLIVDDSMVVRTVFQRILNRQAHFEVAGACSSVDDALRFLDQETVDVILLDVEMPGRNGLESLPDILSRSKGAAVIIISAHTGENGSRAVEALALGACDTLAKPGTTEASSGFADMLVRKIGAIAAQRVQALDHKLVFASPPPPPKTRGRRPACIAIGASTGGIVAIQQFLTGLPDDIDCPVLITQHLPASFIPYFVLQLGAKLRRPVLIGDAGLPVQPGHVYLAPGNGHMGCAWRGGTVRLNRVEGEFAARYTPAVDPMLMSVANVYGAAAVGVVLSGMGNDGLDGARTLRAERGMMLVQDEDSSVVWGMPGGIATSGLADAIMRPAAMGAYLYHRSQMA